MYKKKIIHYVFLGIVTTPCYLQAAPVCEQWIAKIASAQGDVDIQRLDHSEWEVAHQDEILCYGDTVRTLQYSRVVLKFTNQAVATLEQNSTLIFPEPKRKSTSWFMDLIEGSGFFRSRHNQELDVHTPFLNAVHKGTEFLVTVAPDKTKIAVFDGEVAAENQAGHILITQGLSGEAQRNQSPHLQALTITPENAVQWTLYYPPIADYQSQKLSSIAPHLQSALSAYQHGNLSAALNLLEKLPEAQQDANASTLTASLLLTVGRLDEAQPLINKALKLEPNNSTAVALQAIIAVAKNQHQTAMELAQKSVSLNPQSGAAHIALSYAYQSQFKVEEALKASQTATGLAPNNALAWARLSELQLSVGDRDAALASAQKAQTLNPNLGRIHTIKGFADLAENNIATGKAAFEQAIALDSSDPIARLGLGLAKIRQGQLEDGKSDLEIAVNLDPNNAILRSYLGKSFYELKNKDFAGKEFDIAKTMDAIDPTPWFYDAILKQTTNRPVEALHDMQKAIELNDNRGVYRSSLLLDEDRAARAVSLSRIYNNLGFNQLAINASTSSLSRNQSNYSAHRFLFDSYSQRQRYESARVSELLQTQLLQPININPVQPETVETNLNILTGTSPSSVGFNEYTALFDKNGDQFLTTGTIGNNDTYADQAVLSGIHKQLSYSLGQFHYQTNGFRDNNKLKHDLYNVFTQAAITKNLNVQFEYRHRESRKGDLTLNFLPSDVKNVAIDTTQDTPRLGVHYTVGNHSDLLFSFMYTDKKEGNSSADKSLPFLYDFSLKNSGYDFQGQYLYKSDIFNITTGLSYFDIKNNININVNNIDKKPLVSLFKNTINFSSDWFDSYLYANAKFPQNMLWTLGLSYVSFSDKDKSSVDLININRINPKVGLEWEVFKKIKLRMAYFETVKRSLLFEQSIEPTQLARFNQFFDDQNGTIAKNSNLGLDIEFSDTLFGGLELSKRDLAVPQLQDHQFENQKENNYRAYLFWSPHTDWTFSAKYNFEQFRREPTRNATGTLTDPSDSTISHLYTTSVPLSIRYFNPTGFFWSGVVTYVNQTATYTLDKNLPEKNADFFVVDTSIGYRLPKRFGLVSLEIKNILDNNFQYQDPTIFGNAYTQPIYTPDRTIFGRFILNF